MEAFKQARTLRLADGPDEVHWRTAGRLEMTMQQSRETPLGRLGADTPLFHKRYRRSFETRSVVKTGSGHA